MRKGKNVRKEQGGEGYEEKKGKGGKSREGKEIWRKKERRESAREGRR